MVYYYTYINVSESNTPTLSYRVGAEKSSNKFDFSLASSYLRSKKMNENETLGWQSVNNFVVELRLRSLKNRK